MIDLLLTIPNSPKLQGVDVIKELTQENYVKELSPHRLAIVKVYASWCGPCRFMKAAYKRYSKRFEEYEGIKIPFYQIDNEKNPEFVRKFEANALPTFMFFVHGILVFKLQGITRTKVVEKLIIKSLEIPVRITKNGNPS